MIYRIYWTDTPEEIEYGPGFKYQWVTEAGSAAEALQKFYTVHPEGTIQGGPNR